MGVLALVWGGIWRKPTRTIFTTLSLAVGFLLFGLLQGVNTSFETVIGRSKADRLMIDPRFEAPLPQSYASRIAEVPGVGALTWTTFFTGTYQRPDNNIVVVLTDPETFFDVRTEYEMPDEYLEAFRRTRGGILLFEPLANREGWDVGDTVTLESTTLRTDGTTEWTFDVVGIMRDPDNPNGFPFALGHYAYFDEARAVDKGTVTRFVALVDDPRRSMEVARSIDDLFGNSSAPSLTQAENEMAQSTLATVGDVSKLTTFVSTAVFFAILFLTGNVMLQSVRERTRELAVLKTLGFSSWSVAGFVCCETVAICLAGAALGLAASVAVFHLMSTHMMSVNAWLGTPEQSPIVVVWGIVFSVLLAIVSAALPVWRSMSINLVDALRAR